jgi:secreted protein with Ig-like and vWFA domain
MAKQKNEKPQVEFTARTVISDAGFRLILNKINPSFATLVEQFQQDSEAVDVAVTEFARISSQARCENGASEIFGQPSNTAEALVEKVLRWVQLNPAWVTGWRANIDELDATWNLPELSPTPPPDMTGE